MAWLPGRTGQRTGWPGRGSGADPVPARAEEHAWRRGAAPRAASAPAPPCRKDLRLSFLGAPWPCQPSLGCAIVLTLGSHGLVARGSATYGFGEFSEVRDQAVDIRLIVLHGDQPLLDLAPRRQENPAVVLVEPVSVAVPVVHAEEAAVVGDRLAGEDHAALGARGDHVRGEPVRLDGDLDAGGSAQAEALDPLVR